MSNKILTTRFGRKLGLGLDGNLIVNGKESNQSGLTTVVTVTSAQMLALNATPVVIVPAAGAGLAIIPRMVAMRHAGGTAYGGIAAGEDLVLKYTNGSGAQCSGVVETTGFLDQTTAQVRVVGPPGSTGATAGDYAPVANAAVVLHLLVGEITTGNFPLIVKVWYGVINTAFTL